MYLLRASAHVALPYSPAHLAVPYGGRQDARLEPKHIQMETHNLGWPAKSWVGPIVQAGPHLINGTSLKK
jgi:hypothetical protein